MTLDATGASSNQVHINHTHIFKNLAMFLHGALGLNPSEVMYGICMKDKYMHPISHGEIYCIEIPSKIKKKGNRPEGSSAVLVPLLNDLCQWWSITVYGDDLFLMPNEANSFSVNSIQMQMQLGNSNNDTTPNNDECVRILCSPNPPSHYCEKQLQVRDDNEKILRILSISSDMLWIPLPMSDIHSSKKNPKPRLILRGMLYMYNCSSVILLV